LDPDSLRAGAIGAMLVRIAEELPNEAPEALLKRIEAGPERDIALLTEAARSALREGLSETAQRAKATLGLLELLRPKADSADA
jgi:hypothetical protein